MTPPWSLTVALGGRELVKVTIGPSDDDNAPGDAVTGHVGFTPPVRVTPFREVGRDTLP